jgi:hypothetical protein
MENDVGEAIGKTSRAALDAAAHPSAAAPRGPFPSGGHVHRRRCAGHGRIVDSEVDRRDAGAHIRVHGCDARHWNTALARIVERDMKKLLPLIIIGFTALLAAPVEASTRATEPVPAIDWDRDFTPVLVDNGLVVESCDGDGPFVCVTTDDGINLGHVEHLSHPTTISTLPELKAEARRFLSTIGTDREEGCADGYVFRRSGTPVRTVAGGKGVKFSFTVSNAAGKVVERTVGYMAVSNGHLHVLNAPAYGAGGCLANEGEFSVGALQAFERSFGALVAASPLRNLP